MLLLAAFAGCGEPPERPPEAPERPAAGAPGAPPPAGAVALAVTIDDLPWVGPAPPGETRVEGTREILAALRENGAPATGFVNCGRVEPGAPVLRLWLDAGMQLGNHTAQHLDLNYADPDAWIADARSCDAFLRDLTGRPFVAFRYPYLHRGPTVERYRAGRAVLDALDSPIAPVTIDTGDWILDDPYVAALRAGDAERAREIGRAFVAHVLRAAEHYREVARERVGRDVAHVLLLHAHGLLADWLDPLLEALRAEGFRFVPLEEALEDPVYDLQDDYIGPEGLSWLYRFEPATPEARAWDLEEAARVRAELGL